MTALAVALVAIALVLRSCHHPHAQGMSAPMLQTAGATRGDVVQTVACGGKVTAKREVEIKCKATGQIVNLPVDSGDQVKAGAVLIELDPGLEKRRLRQAQIDLDSAEARRLQAKSQLETTQQEKITTVHRTQIELATAVASAQDAALKAQRAATLFSHQLVSQEENEAAQLASLQAHNALGEAQSRVDDLPLLDQTIEERRQDLALATAAVETQRLLLDDANERLNDTRVLSPINGVVVAPKVQTGQIISGVSDVTGGTQVMTLADLSQVFVLADVDESQIGQVAVGQAAVLELDAMPDQTFDGVVRRVAPEGTTDKGGGIVSFEVTVEVVSSNHTLLRPEMTATLDIHTGEAKGVLLVPITAIQHRKGKTIVWTPGPNGSRVDREVRIGLSDGEHVQILSGLAEKEQVVVESAGGESKWKNDGD